MNTSKTPIADIIDRQSDLQTQVSSILEILLTMEKSKIEEKNEIRSNPVS